MKIEFKHSFFESLKKYKRDNSFLYKLYNFFRRDLPYFFENVWFFRKELWNFRSWDYSYNLSMFRRSLEKTVNTVEFYGHEVDKSRLKKVEKMKRLIQILNNMKSHSYIEVAEKEFGELIMRDFEFVPTSENPELFSVIDSETPEEKEHNKKIYDRAREIEEQEWVEFCQIIKGQDIDEYRKLYEELTDKEKHEKDLWNEWFDGSGIRGWWD